MKYLRNNHSQSGHLALLLPLIVIVALVMFLASTRLPSQQFVKPSTLAATATDPRFATAGPAAPVLGDLYTYLWDAMSDPVPPDQSAPAPNHKFFWLVGKLDNRHDGLSCNPCTLAKLDQIFTSEQPKISNLLSKDINKGGVWIVGNEANATPWIDPSLYAQQFKKYRDLIKSLDPTAQVGHSGLVYFATYSLNNNNPIPYLDAFLKALPSSANRPDLYNIHLYPDLVDVKSDVNSVNQARDFKNHVNSIAADKPIWVTEVGVNANPPKKIRNRVQSYMDTVINGLKNENLAQRWFWFIGSSEPGYEATALTANGQLTDLGKHYQQLMGAASPNPTTSPSPSSTPKKKIKPSKSPSKVK